MSEVLHTDAVPAKRPKQRSEPLPKGWVRDGGDIVWIPDDGAKGVVRPNKHSGWKAMVWNTPDGRAHEFKESFKTLEAAMSAVETFDQQDIRKAEA